MSARGANVAGERRSLVRVRAPTAQSLNLQLFNHAADATPSTIMPMQENNGAWSVCVDDSWNGKYYLFDVRALATELGHEPTHALQKRLEDLRLKARHEAPAAIGCPRRSFRR